MRLTKNKSRVTLWWGMQSHLTFELGRVPSWDLGFKIDFGTEDVTLGLYLFLADFYISLDSQRVHKFLNRHPNHFYKATWEKDSPVKSYWEEREIGIMFDFRSMIFTGSWWTNMNNEPRSRYFYWVLADFFMGRNKYSDKVLQEGGIDIDMPEGVYNATFKRFISYWKRPRLPFTKKIERITIDIPVGIPHQGKGENSYDMGMDATFSSTFPVKKDESIYQIAKRFAMECLKTRQRYGSLHSPEYSKWKLQGEMKLAAEDGGSDVLVESAKEAANGKIKNRTIS